MNSTVLGQGSHRYELKVMCAMRGAKTLQQLFYSKNPHLDGMLGFSNKKTMVQQRNTICLESS